MPIQIVSVNVGRPREVEWKRTLVSTAIFKEPITTRVRVRKLNLDGDEQADLSVHGGPEKAVYAYPSEHYEFWERELHRELNWGMFGENLTLSGATEDTVRIGDRYRVGSAVLMVTQPRVPCYKLALKFGRDDIIKRFLDSGRSGFYFSVIEEGELGAGDTFEYLGGETAPVTVSEVNQLFSGDEVSAESLDRAMKSKALPLPWRMRFAQHFRTPLRKETAG